MGSRYGSVKVASLMPEYSRVHGFLNMLNPINGLSPDDPALMARRIIERVGKAPHPCIWHWGSRTYDCNGDYYSNEKNVFSFFVKSSTTGLADGT